MSARTAAEPTLRVAQILRSRRAGLVLARLLVRLSRGAPAPEGGIPHWQKRAARVSHAALYLLILIVPSSAGRERRLLRAGQPVLGTVADAADLGGMPVGEAILKVHAAGPSPWSPRRLHVAAARHHHIFRRDGTLRRMLAGH